MVKTMSAIDLKVCLNFGIDETATCFNQLSLHSERVAVGELFSHTTSSCEVSFIEWCLVKKMYNVRSASLGVKRNLYEKLVVITVMCGTETWHLRDQERNQLE